MSTEPISLPWTARTDRPDVFDPPAVFGELRDERPLRPMRYADGHVGWLATGYDVVRSILADRRFTIRRDLAHPPHERLVQDTEGGPPVPGLFVRMDPPDHTRYRKLLVGEFTVRRMRQLESRIAEAARDCLDAMARSGPPVDLVQALSLPVPTSLIAELLGIPAGSREQFWQLVERSLAVDATAAERERAGAELVAFFQPLVDAKRATPTDDIYSGMVNGTDLTDQELGVIGVLLFGAGFETTASALTIGTYALIRHPQQVDALRADPSLADNMVEEVLRYPTGPGGMVRTALEDVEVGGEVIEAGQTVELLVGAANRDPARFERPDEFDITRSARGQLSFGHGIHQCLGQQLARVELRTVLPALFDRFPALRLAVPPQDVRLRDDTPLYSIASLPVEW